MIDLPSSHQPITSRGNPSLVECMLANAMAHPEVLAAVQGEHTWTFGRFASDVRRLSAGMLAQGIRPGDRIVLQLGNCVPALLACYAGLAIGAIVVPIDPAFKIAEMKRLLDVLQPSLYLAAPELDRLLEDSIPSFLPAGRRFTVEAAHKDGRSGTWQTLLANDDPDVFSFTHDPDAHAILIATSGATGDPKLVTHTQKTLLHTVELAIAFGWNRNVKAVCHAPLYRPLGAYALVMCMSLGVPCILAECSQFEPGPVLDAIERHRCTRVAAPPLEIAKLIRAQREAPRKVDCLSSCMVFGDSAAPELFDDFERVFGTPLHNLVAMSEAIGCLYLGTNNRSVRAVPGLAKLVDEHGAPTPEGDAGELVVRGENLFKGYWKSPGVVDDPKRDGWYHTGDMMRQTEDGEWSYEIRRSDVILRAGQRLSPVEIARVLMTHPAVADAAVAGVTDPFLGQRVVGFIELVDPSRPCDTNDILVHAAHQLADYKVPEVLAVVDKIPRNGVGKVSRRVLAAMAAQFEVRVGDLE